MIKQIFLLFMYLSITVFSQTEMKYNAKSENLPNWAELMYSENPNDGEVIKLYREFLEHWLRLSRLAAYVNLS